MIKKLSIILLLSLSQNSYSLLTTSAPKVVDPPLALPVLENATDEVVEVSLTYYYLTQVTALRLFGAGRIHTGQAKVKGPTLALELQTGQQITAPIPTSYSNGTSTFNQDHLVKFRIVANSASQQRLAITQHTDFYTTPHLQVHAASSQDHP